MVRSAVLLFALLGAVSALKLDADFSDGERPVAKVLGMLRDMQAQLQSEADNDAELYDKLVCWCETNDKEKTGAIAVANQMIKEFTASISELTAKDQQLTTEIATAKSDIAKTKKALEEASTLRAKELAEFDQDEKDAIQSIGSLKGALTNLQKANAGASSLLQRQALLHVSQVLRKSHVKVAETVAPHHRRLVRELLSRPEGMVSLMQQPAGYKSYNAASGEIFGMLKQMKESFESNLVTSKDDDATSAKNFAQLKTAKLGELKALADKQFNKEADLGDTKEKNANAKQDLKNTENALASDTAFLADLKNKCATMDADWEARSKMRGEEIKAISETIAILDDDDAHDQIAKSLGLIQLHTKSSREAGVHKKVVEYLRKAGKQLNSPRLSYLAMKSRFDPFGALRNNIDDMSGALAHEKEDEIVHKDDCVSDLNENEVETNTKHGVKGDLETDISSLDNEIDTLNDEEKKMIQEIADAQKQMKIASANRQAENKDYQQTLSDQRATQEILEKAVAKLGEFYNKKAALLQQVPGAEVEAMPAGFSEYKKGNGGGAMAMIQAIIDDSKQTVADAITSELDAQSAYEEFVKDTNKSIKAKQAGITQDEEQEASDKVEESHDQTDRKHTVRDILSLGDMAKSIHGECDFTLDNFEERQSSRDHEIEALEQAKAIFSGAGFGR